MSRLAALLLASLLASTALAQRPLPIVAVLNNDAPLSRACTSDAPTPPYTAFLEGLASLGYRDGVNVVLECRSAEGHYERLDALAAELVRLRPAVIVAASTPASLAAKRATSSIPIVSVYGGDPVALHLVESLARPRTNVTGISSLAQDYAAFAAKSLQLLKRAAPRTSRVGVVGYGNDPIYGRYRTQVEQAGKRVGLVLDFQPVGGVDEVEAALGALQARKANAIFVIHQPFTFQHRERIVQAISKRRLPAVYGAMEAVQAGGLISYGVSIPAVFRRSTFFVDKIVKGAKPGDLPFEQPTIFELAINRRTAEALRLALPQDLLLSADRVIE